MLFYDEMFWMHPEGYFSAPFLPKPEKKKRKYVKSGKYAKKNPQQAIARLAEHLKNGSNTLPIGTDAQKNGTNISSIGTNIQKNGTDFSSVGASIQKKGTNISSIGTDMQKKGTNFSSKNTDFNQKQPKTPKNR